jgi:hypothetical protein
MSRAPIFSPGSEFNIITRGPGTLQLLSYNTKSGLPANISALRVTAQGISNYILAAAPGYDRFAFIWTGEDEAVSQIGNSLLRQPIGRRWEAASTVERGGLYLAPGRVEQVAQPLITPEMPYNGLIYAVAKNLPTSA